MSNLQNNENGENDVPAEGNENVENAAGGKRPPRDRKLSQTQELKAITLDPRASKEARELASQVQEMRANSKALGVPTDILDQFADKALSSEIQATQERLASQDGEEA